MASIKVQYQNELRRLSPSTSSSSESWSSLEARISQLLSLPVGEFAVKYTDEDGDLITLSTDAELADLLLVNKKAQSIRLQVFPKSASPSSSSSSLAAPVVVSPAAAPAPAPVNEVRREVKEEEEDPEDPEDDEEDSEDSEDEEETAASQEAKGKAPVDEYKPAAKEEKEEPKPSLKEIQERAAKLGQHIQDVLDQHPEIEEEIEAIKELFAAFVVHQVKEQQRQQEEIRQRHREFLAARFAHFFGGHPAFAFHPEQQPESQQEQQRCQQRCQKAREEAPRPSSARCGNGFRPQEGCQPKQFCFQRGAGEEPRRHPFAQAFEEKLSILENMGFIDRDLNVFLLRKHRGSLESIIQELSEIHSQF